jgi:protein gp37
MGEVTGISWTEATWNPWHGCIKISPGCKFCYMYRDKERYGQDPTKVVRSKTTFTNPMRWKEPRVIFTCSWSDFFIEEADGWRPEAWEVIRKTPQHTYQILTKRPELIAARLPEDWGQGYENVWLGVSVENQKYADERVPALLNTPAKIRFLSIEPILGPVELVQHDQEFGFVINWLTGFDGCDPAIPGIDWVICGGESGPERRPMQTEWATSLRDQCKEAGVKFFMKQMGGLTPAQGKAAIPPELMIQEFPR